MANDLGVTAPAAGAALLKAYLAHHDLTQFAAAEALFVSDPCVNDWVNGKKRPEPHHRTAIAHWTSDAVPVESWLRDDEIAKVAAVVPFVPKLDAAG